MGCDSWEGGGGRLRSRAISISRQQKIGALGSLLLVTIRTDPLCSAIVPRPMSTHSLRYHLSAISSFLDFSTHHSQT